MNGATQLVKLMDWTQSIVGCSSVSYSLEDDTPGGGNSGRTLEPYSVLSFSGNNLNIATSD